MATEIYATLHLSFGDKDRVIAKYHVPNCVAARRASTPEALDAHNRRAGHRLQLEIEKALAQFFIDLSPTEEPKTILDINRLFG